MVQKCLIPVVKRLINPKNVQTSKKWVGHFEDFISGRLGVSCDQDERSSDLRGILKLIDKISRVGVKNFIENFSYGEQISQKLKLKIIRFLYFLPALEENSAGDRALRDIKPSYLISSSYQQNRIENSKNGFDVWWNLEVFIKSFVNS